MSIKKPCFLMNSPRLQNEPPHASTGKATVVPPRHEPVRDRGISSYRAGAVPNLPAMYACFAALLCNVAFLLDFSQLRLTPRKFVGPMEVPTCGDTAPRPTSSSPRVYADDSPVSLQAKHACSGSRMFRC